MKTSMDKISRPGVDDDGSGDVSTQWTSTSVVRGHPVYAVVANRIAHYNKVRARLHVYHSRASIATALFLQARLM